MNGHEIFLRSFSRFALIAIFACSMALSVRASTPSSLPDKIKFSPNAPLYLKQAPWRLFIVGDTGNKSAQQKAVAEQLARQTEKIKTATPQSSVNAVVFVGDNFYENGVKDTDDPLWREAFENVYDRKRLTMPFFAALGNHDWVQNP